MSTLIKALGWGVAAAGLVLIFGYPKKKTAGGEAVPPPDRPPYTGDPLTQNPVGAWPGVQHLLIDQQSGAPGLIAEFAGRPPKTVVEAAEKSPLRGGPARLFEGTTAIISRDPSNPFAAKNRQFIVQDSEWREWSEGPVVDWAPVVFQRDSTGSWTRITPAVVG